MILNNIDNECTFSNQFTHFSLLPYLEKKKKNTIQKVLIKHIYFYFLIEVISRNPNPIFFHILIPSKALIYLKQLPPSKNVIALLIRLFHSSR